MISQMSSLGDIAGDLVGHGSALTPSCHGKSMAMRAATVQQHDRYCVAVSWSGQALPMTK